MSPHVKRLLGSAPLAVVPLINQLLAGNRAAPRPNRPRNDLRATLPFFDEFFEGTAPAFSTRSTRISFFDIFLLSVVFAFSSSEEPLQSLEG